MRHDPLLDLEHRADRHGFDLPSTLCHPNGTHVVATDVWFLGAAGREVIAAHLAAAERNAHAA